MRPVLSALFCAGLATSLPAQDKLNLGWKAGDDGIVYQFQGRAVRAGGGLDEVVGSRSGGGAGFSALFGDAPLRLRIRMDGDSFPGRDGNGAVSTAGLGVEGVLSAGSGSRFAPFLSIGAAFQHWEIAQNRTFPAHSSTYNGLAGRVELGMRCGRRLMVSLGVLAGKVGPGRSATNPYLAVTF